MQIRKTTGLVAVVATIFAAAQTQPTPKEIWGRWEVRRELPTRTISCWGESDARRIIGTQIEYSDKIFRWKQIIVNNPVADERIVTADQFRKENSSPSADGSQIDFQQLGILDRQTKEISIRHDPANITRATVEIPGDSVLVKNADTIVFSVCSIYFEATRIRDKK